MSQAWLLVAGMVTSLVLSLSAAMLARRKTDAEVARSDAEAADLLSQGAVRLVPYYESRLVAQQVDINDLKHRVIQAEAAEARCLVRVEALQTQINELRDAMKTPPPMVTVTTTQVTQSEPLIHTEETP